MKVRPAHPGERPALAAAAARAGSAYTPDGELVLVAVDDHEQVVGWLSGTLAGAYPGPGAPCPPPHGYVQAVVVAPGARRRGYGHTLLAMFVSRARQAGVQWLFAAPDEGPGVEARAAWLASAGWEPVDDPGEAWPVMGRWTTPRPCGRHAV
ncbi:GNAT family N-acetyltransferase (plasmid) [Nocardiopsis sp. MT53]|uniref:GNAT family N-acetyltransferase n=1 Tax=Nocardiopsis changdeensis TaxID=2831969 RepID=A0ABX8C1D7_9ACTN|nr:GNAT family N-acetyltransferase [Nocardiopsis changdeensis]QYX40817.1 GNAT family N-acetyltransferase [Nocardiopsis sp. MT53]